MNNDIEVQLTCTNGHQHCELALNVHESHSGSIDWQATSGWDFCPQCDAGHSDEELGRAKQQVIKYYQNKAQHTYDPPRDLEELSEYLKLGFGWQGAPIKGGDVDWSALPIFGGEEPANTQEIWSWDETRLLVGTYAYDLDIVPRAEWFRPRD